MAEFRVAMVHFRREFASRYLIQTCGPLTSQIASMNRQSKFRGPVTSNKSRNDGSQSSGDSEKGMWSSMLDSVASGKKLPEKNLVVLG